MKFHPQTTGKPTTATFATVHEHLVHKVQSTYSYGEDIATCLLKMEKITLVKPKKQKSTLTNANDKVEEQDQFNEEHKIDYQNYTDRVRALDFNLPKAYSFIKLHYCTPAMQKRIEQHPDFDSINNDPIARLKAIRGLIQDPIRARYPLASLFDIITRLMTFKQGETEGASSYIKRMKETLEQLKSHIGTTFLDFFIETTGEYKALGDPDADNITPLQKTGIEEKQATMKKDAFEQLCGYAVLRAADPKKYGSILRNL